MSQLQLLSQPGCQLTAFRMIEDYYTGEDGNYLGYGIEAYEGEELLLQFEDVTCDRQWMQQFLEKINNGGLSLVHLYDVLMDNMP